MSNIPVLDANSPNFDRQLDFALSTTFSDSDISNDRNRPYGQPQTDDGIRGSTLVQGLTIRDLRDCLIKGILESCPEDEYLGQDFLKCWEFGQSEAIPTKFLLDKQKEGKYVSTKVDMGTWRVNDVYNVDLSKADPIAICQSFCCQIEKMMGIFPNVEKLHFMNDEQI